MKNGTWFATFTGTKFYLTDPRPEDVFIEDISHALSMVCRFGGHTCRFYSVAQHSVYCQQVVEEWHPKDYLLHLHTLLHDASEAYLGDVVRPLKLQMPDYQVYEAKMTAAIYVGLGLPEPTDEQHAIIKRADNILLMTERRDLIKHRGIEWTVQAQPWTKKIIPWSNSDAEHRFFLAYEHLRAKVPST